MSLSGRQGGYQLRERDEIEDSPEIIGECSQAEFGANLLQATHQKCALIYPLFDRAKRVFDRLATSIDNTGALREPRLHSVQGRFVLKARYRVKLAVGALRTGFAVVACQFVGVVDLLQSAQKRR